MLASPLEPLSASAQSVASAITGIGALVLAALWFVRGRQRGRVLKFPRENLSFTTVGRPWRVDNRNKPKWALVYFSGPRGSRFWIMPTRADYVPYLDARTACQNIVSNLEGTAISVQIVRRDEINVAGRAGALIEVETHQKEGRFHDVFVVVTQNGYLHQFVLRQHARSADSEFVERELPRLLAGHAFLDPARTAHADQPACTKKFVSKHFGWSFTPDPAVGWRQWPADWEDPADAELALLHPELATATFHALAVPHATAAFDALAAGALAQHGLDASASSTRIISEEKGGAARTVVYAAETGSEPASRAARVVVARRGPMLFSVAVQAPAEREGRLDALMAHLRAGWTLPPEDMELADGVRKKTQVQRLSSRIARAAGEWLMGRGRQAESLELFEAALGLRGEVPEVLGAALEACSDSGRYADGVRLLEKYGDRPELRATAKYWKPIIFERAERHEEALAAYAELIDAGAPEGAFFAWMRLLWRMGRKDEVRERTAARLERGDPRVRVVLADLHEQDGDVDQALALLDHKDVECQISRSGTLVRAGRSSEGLAVLDALAQRGTPESTRMLVARAMGESGQGWLRQAQETLQRAARLDPSDPEIPQFLESVTRQLGEGSTHLVRRAIDAVAIPEAFLIDAEPAHAAGEDVAALLEVRALHVERGGGVRQTCVRRLRARTSAGAEGLATISIGFEPARESLFVHELVVRDPAGAVAARGRIEDWYVVDGPAQPAAAASKQLVLPVPALRPGGVLEVRFSREEHFGDGQFWFRTEHLSAGAPAARSVLLLSGAIAELEVRLGPGVVETRAGELRVFTAEDPPWEAEHNEPPAHGVRPVVLLGARGGSFERVGRDYLEKIAAVLGEPSERVAAVARELIAGAADDELRVARIARFVQSSVSYHAVAFGPRGWMPDAAERTLERGLGDCKAKSLLLHQLCRAVGIQSHLALISTEEDVVEVLPDRGQFDHMILFLPAIRGGWFVDPTQSRLDPLSAPPRGLSGRKALVLDPAAPRLVAVPPAPEIRVRLAREARIDADGDILGADVLTYSGLAAAVWRDVFASIPPAMRGVAFEEVLNRAGGACSLESIQLEGLDEVERDFVLRVEWRVRSQLRSELPPLDVAAIVPQRAARRRLPFRLRHRLVVEHRTVLRAPSGGAFAPALPSRTGSELDFATWHGERSATAEAITVTGAIQLPPGTYPAERFAEFRAATLKSLESLRVPFALDASAMRKSA